MSTKRGSYQSALKFILDREHFGIKLGIENIGNFLKDVGNPHHNFKSVHIAGTNGKGSTAAYIDAIMREAGLRVGIFTSPHLVDFRERIRVNGKQIDKKFIADFIARNRRVIDKNKITFFEVCTALAFCYFAHRKVDLAVIETGLGGRLDATNTLHPVLSIITDISFDHTNILGRTLRKIAFEKAGIIKDNVPVLIGTMKPEPRREIIKVGRIKNSPIVYQRPKFISAVGKRFHFGYLNGDFQIDNLVSSLPGRHQITNAALAVTACSILNLNGFKIGKRIIRRGLKSTYWPGRFQVERNGKGPTVILDVGHNPAGIKAMARCFKEMYPGKKASLVLGFVRHKSLNDIVKNLIPIAKSVDIAALKTDRGTDPKIIASVFRRNGFKASISDSISNSAKKLIESARSDDIIIICGSHFAVGEFLENRKAIYGK